jgi:hypothetical protein
MFRCAVLIAPRQTDLPGLTELAELGNAVLKLSPAVLLLSEHLSELPPAVVRKLVDGAPEVFGPTAE